MTEYPGPHRFRYGLRLLIVLLCISPPLVGAVWAFWRFRQQTVDTSSDLICCSGGVFFLVVAGLMVGASLLGDYFNKDNY